MTGRTAIKDDAIVRLPAVLARLGVSRTTLYKLIGLKEFPAPLKLGTVAGWRASDLDRWIAERQNPSDAARRPAQGRHR